MCRQCNVVCAILFSVPLLHYLVLVPLLSKLSVVIVFLLLLLLYLFLRGFNKVFLSFLICFLGVPIQRITLASNAEGWDKMVNGQLESTLALDDRVLVTGFVPGNTQQQREHARELKIDLFDAKFISGYSSTELLAYPPDDLNIDILMMHSYGRDVGRQAQIIKDTKNCKWVLVVHTVSEELEKYAQKAASRAAVNEPISEHELQVKLCEKADLVVAVGPKVAEAYKAALRYCGKQDSIFTLMPKISSEFLGVRQSSDTKSWDTGEKFRILISGSAKYFKVKGCDIAAKAINLLQDSSYHLILVVLRDDNIAEIQQAMCEEGINVKQLTVRRCSGTTEVWHRLLCEVDLLIKPSRTEGFGMSGLRAVSADLPLLVSSSCGLGIALKSLPSGRNHVVDSDEPKIWADKIKEVREKGFKTCHIHAEQLRSEYTARFLWEEQIDHLLRVFSEMVAQNQGMKSITFDLQQCIMFIYVFENCASKWGKRMDGLVQNIVCLDSSKCNQVNSISISILLGKFLFLVYCFFLCTASGSLP